jgi:uncharacterized membrane protein
MKKNESHTNEERRCQICGRTKKSVTLLPAEILRPAIENLIHEKYPDWNRDGFICRDDLNKYRFEYVKSLMELEHGELTTLEKDVLDSIKNEELISTSVDKQFDSKLTFGQRLSDKIAEFGGSWKFIIIFLVIIFIWMGINSYLLLSKPYDPYPFILLNLVLSCLAAIQAPVIMMSQNRQETKDRLRGEYDYKINLKAELEIRQLHQKLDHLLMHQWERLLEIQEIQLEFMSEFRDKKKS